MRSSSKTSKTDWARFRAMKDRDIKRTSEHPEADTRHIVRGIVRRGTVELNGMPLDALLRLYAEILEELRGRGVTRSTNNPVADYTEYVVAKSLKLTRTANSERGHDAVDAQGHRYQIKGRRITARNPSTELSAIRNLPQRPFDLLVAVVYRADFTIDYAGIVPHEVVSELAKYVQHANAYRFLMKRSVLDDPRVTDVTSTIISNM